MPFGLKNFEQWEATEVFKEGREAVAGMIIFMF